MDRHEELREINEQRKQLIQRQKELLRELNDSKGDRVEAKKALAGKVKQVNEDKAALRKSLAGMKYVLKSKNTSHITIYVDNLSSSVACLLKDLRDFSRTVERMEDL